jgi:hypothetical protein
LPSRFKPELIGTAFGCCHVTLIVGVLFKLVLVVRLFGLTRDKLMKIPAFALPYTRYREIKAWLKNTEAWRAIRAFGKSAGQYLTEIKKTAALRYLKSRRSLSRGMSVVEASSFT